MTKPTENQPLVTVNILSFNRKNDLRNTLQKVYEQDYKNIEVIVVDNASTDGSPEMVEKEFPEVKLIRLEKNIGIAGWNKGFEAANGEYVLVLDDDAYPEKNSVSLIVENFLNHTELGAIALRVLNIYENNEIKPFPGGWVPTETLVEEDWGLILGCGFAIKRNLFVPNLFVKNYFINFHEFPIILHLFENGYKIMYSNNIVVYHVNQKLNPLNSSKKEYFHFRNMINFVYYHFYKPKNFTFLLRIIFFYLPSVLKRGWFLKFAQALFNLRKPMVDFTDYRFSKKETLKIISTGVLNYKFIHKLKFLNEKNKSSIYS